MVQKWFPELPLLYPEIGLLKYMVSFVTPENYYSVESGKAKILNCVPELNLCCPYYEDVPDELFLGIVITFPQDYR